MEMHALSNSALSSDIFAGRTNLLTGIDVRVKTAFVLAALVLNLLSTGMSTQICIAGICIAALISIKIPAKLLLLRLSIPLLMAAVVLITQTFMSGTTPIFSVDIISFHLSAYKEGLDKGLLIMCRVIAGTSLILFLSMSTPAHKLLRAARWFRMPAVLVELSLLIYRYVFVLMEQMLIMQESQTVRLGYRNWQQSMNSLSALGAGVILRAYDRAERVYESMLVRGYAGDKTSATGYTLNFVDLAATLIFAAVLAGLYVIGQFVR
jgi:cobalt/nickel transport system permease protein